MHLIDTIKYLLILYKWVTRITIMGYDTAHIINTAFWAISDLFIVHTKTCDGLRAFQFFILYHVAISCHTFASG